MHAEVKVIFSRGIGDKAVFSAYGLYHLDVYLLF